MKKSLVFVLGIMLFVVLGCSMLGTKKAEDKVDTPKPGDESTETTSKSDDKDDKDSKSDKTSNTTKGDLTLEAFDKLDFGMSYDEVKKVMGTEGDETQSSQVGKYESKTFVWKDNAQRISVSFRNDELRFMSQYGLTGSSGDADISKDKFDKIKTGMDYSEVKDMIGSDGEKTSMSKIGDASSISYVWKGDKYASLRATFSDKKLQRKSQSNLK